MKNRIQILFEDTHFLVINKPPGIPVVPKRNDSESISVKSFFQKKRNEIFIVHRIDEETSGLIILAKDPETHKSLNKMFEDRQISKSYLLLCRGTPKTKDSHISLPLKKLKNKNKSIVHKDGKEAITKFEVIQSFPNISYCKAQILTGRHHQIRVHFKYLNYPLLVDPEYGDNAFFLSEIKKRRYNISKDKLEKPLLSRLSLHASEISFIHPRTKERMSFTAPLPKDMNAVIKQLEKAF